MIRLEGNGKLLQEGTSLRAVRYEIHVSEPDELEVSTFGAEELPEGQCDWSGTLHDDSATLTDYAPFEDIAAAENLSLELDDGTRIPVVVDHCGNILKRQG